MGCTDAVDRARVVTVASVDGNVILKAPAGGSATFTVGQSAQLRLVLGMAWLDAYEGSS